MNILGVIPARIGSKGVYKKNIKELNGIPLISYTIRTALQSNQFTDLIVSTDSEEVKIIAEEEGALVPFIRESNLSHDKALAIPVIQDATSKMISITNKKYDAICMLQPTSPLREVQDFINVVNLFKEKNVDSVISVVEVSQHPYKMVKKDPNGFLSPFIDWSVENPPRQELPDLYTYNGAFYLTKFSTLMEENSFRGSCCYMYEMPLNRSVNIDNENDFLLAEILINKYNK